MNNLKTLRIILILISLGWLVNVVGLGYVCYTLFGAGFICHPEGLPQGEEKDGS